MVLRILYLLTGVSALLAARDHEMRDYYAIHVEKKQNVRSAVESLDARLEHAFDALEDHYLVSTPKGHQVHLRKRSAAIKYIEKQHPRQRHKRGGYPEVNVSRRDLARTRDESELEDLQTIRSHVQEALNIQDPLFSSQWHLFNTRDRGYDINVTGVWAQGITGKNTVVALVDDGIDMNSLDLAPNYYAEGSYDFNDHNPVPSPKLFDDNHGTRCAGEIAAVRNDVCGIGVAYDAKVSGLRILSGRITDADEAISLNYDFHNNLIYSCSWGPPDDGKSMEVPGVLIKRAIVNGIQKGRNGKGSIFVFASGNGAVYEDNCNFDGYTNSIFSITIGGIDRLENHPYYSELCAPQLAVTYSSGAGDYIHTTDVGENSCSSRHGGTSAAAPIGAGIFALVLSARPDLSWRDLQYLCVETAVPFNLDDADWQDTPAGHKFNHKFGYGKLDAYAIVEKAKNWNNVKAQSWYHSSIVDVNERFGEQLHEQITTYLNISVQDMEKANLQRVEHVTVTVNIDHERRGDVTVDLISPGGIISNLATARRHDVSEEGFQDWTLMTVKHWGETGIGQWRIVVGDHDHLESAGLFKNWRMTLWGEAIDGTQAKPLSMPGESEVEPGEQESDVSTIYQPVEITTVTPATDPTSTATSEDTVVPIRPVLSKIRPITGETHPSKPTTLSQPLPEQQEYPAVKFAWFSKNSLWIYVAVPSILSFMSLIGIWIFIQKKRTRATLRDNYEFKEIRAQDRNSASERGEQYSANDLYDAFRVSDDDSEIDDADEDSRDGQDQLQLLRK